MESRPGRRQLVRLIVEGPEPQIEVGREPVHDSVKVCDFGLAKLLDGDPRRVTAAGDLAAPAQA